VLRKSFITFAAAVALGCVPIATNALAAGHRGAGHASAGHAMAHHAARGGYHGGRYASGRGGPIYNSYSGGGYGGCPGYGYGYGYGYDNGYGYGGCPGYGVPLVGGIIGGILGR
jgi:hypothetical protein